MKTFWVIQDKKPVVKTIRNLNKRKHAKSIMTFDFSTLYTKIPHDKLKEVLHELTDFCFKGCRTSKILVNEYGATWKHAKNSKGIKFSIDNVKEAISYLLDNCHFNVGDNIFKQRIGIPMGSDPAPFFANLFLYYYEHRFIKELKKLISLVLASLVTSLGILMICLQLMMTGNLKNAQQKSIHQNWNSKRRMMVPRMLLFLTWISPSRMIKLFH